MVQVHGGAAPDLGVLTAAGTEHHHGHCIQIIALSLEIDARSTVAVRAGAIAEDLVAFQNVPVDVDGHVAVHDTAVEATAIDIAAQQTRVFIDVAVGNLHEVFRDAIYGAFWGIGFIGNGMLVAGSCCIFIVLTAHCQLGAGHDLGIGITLSLLEELVVLAYGEGF